MTDRAPELQFIPIGRELVDPLGMDDLLSQAIFGTPSADTIYDYRRGQVIKSYSGVDGNAQMQMLALGAIGILDALQSRQAASFVFVDGRAYRVDSQYWWRRPNPEKQLAGGVGVPEDFVGATILFDPQELPKFRHAAKAAFGPTMAKLGGVPKLQSRARVDRPSRRGSKSGPKKYPAQLRAILLPLFRRHHDRLSDMSRSEKHGFVSAHWSDHSVTIPSDKTVEAAWSEYVDRRASEELG